VNHVTGGAVEIVAPAQATPRAIALQTTAGKTTAVWWTSFSQQGAVLRATVSSSGALGAPEVMASGLDYPNGITVDDASVYWTNRGAGTVLSLPRDASPGDAPVTVATGQAAPGAIVAAADAVYWVSEGGSSSPSGAVVRLPKTP